MLNHPLKKFNNNQGFTLIEILVSVAILAVISGLTYSGLSSVVQSRSTLIKSQNKISEIHRAIIIMERDFLSIAPRVVRGSLNNHRAAFLGSDDSVEFTRSGRPKIVSDQQSIFMRVAYELDDNKLIRKSWNALDRSDSDEPQTLILLKNVSELKFQFYDKSWQTNWPVDSFNNDIEKLRILPKYLKIEITIDKFGTITRLLTGVS